MTRLERILVGAYRDLLHWRSREPMLYGDLWRKAKYNARIKNAHRGIVDCEAARWLNKALTPSDRVSNSRTYRELQARGLTRPTNVTEGSRRTSGLLLTEAGQARAAELLSQITEPAEAGSLPEAATVATLATAATTP